MKVLIKLMFFPCYQVVTISLFARFAIRAGKVFIIGFTPLAKLGKIGESRKRPQIVLSIFKTVPPSPLQFIPMSYPSHLNALNGLNAVTSIRLSKAAGNLSHTSLSRPQGLLSPFPPLSFANLKFFF